MCSALCFQTRVVFLFVFYLQVCKMAHPPKISCSRPEGKLIIFSSWLMKKLWELVCQEDSSTTDGMLGAIDQPPLRVFHFISRHFSSSVPKALIWVCVRDVSSPLDGSSGVLLPLNGISFLFFSPSNMTDLMVSEARAKTLPSCWWVGFDKAVLCICIFTEQKYI